MNRTNKIALAAICIFLPAALMAQTTVIRDAAPIRGTTVVIPGSEYKRSGYHNFFWGKHYRREWSQQVRVANFYLDTAKGGLTPYQKGGGRQSKTLRLKNRKGKEYVIRSVNKDFGRGLPDEFAGTFMSRIAKDQVSIGHPFAAITLTPMARAAGLYHTLPDIVFVPHQPALGEYDDEYGDQLYLFEERPDENHEDSPNFYYSKNIIGTDKLFEHVYEDHDNHVDQLAFARARLFDMVIGDWGRHKDNWRWAEFETGDETIYKPVPRDRDQSYTKMDGLYPSLAGFFYKPLQGFNRSIRGISGWNSPARPLDRKFLNGLSRDAWIVQANELQQVLTDSLISYSIHLLPPELFPFSGEQIIERLRSRRDHLEAYAKKYYASLAKFVDLFGSQDREFFSIRRFPDNTTEINIYKISREGAVSRDPFYTRKFTRKETTEVRIYGLEGRDRIELQGERNRGVKIRIIDPQANDSIVLDNKSLRDRLDISSGHKFEYDTLHEKRVRFMIRPFVSSSIYEVFERSPLKFFPRTGIKVLASVTYIPQPWRKAEYENVHHICANYGIFRGAFNIGYIGRFGHLFGNWDLVIKGRIDAPGIENYFGTGNETEKENDTRNYYRTYSNRGYAGLGIERNFSKYNHIELTAVYNTVKIARTSDHFISEAPVLVVEPTVFDRKNFAGVEGGYSYVRTDNLIFPTRGFGVNAGAGWLTNIAETGKSFAKAIVSSVFFVPLSSQFSLALRAGGATLAGKADYYNLNILGGGGKGELRGYDRERFYGRHAAYVNGDLRWLFNTRNYFFNGKAGLLTFYDAGRVWQPGEESAAWHGSYGFGIILVPYNRFSLTVTYGISKEGRFENFKTGFFF